MNTVRCPRCNGAGHMACYKHVEDGICFLCNGRGVLDQEEFTAYQNDVVKREVSQAKRLQKMDELRETARANKAAKRAEDERKRKETDEYNRTHPRAGKSESEKAFDDFWKYMEGEE
jgi:RecJ-like exonuclease